MAKKKDCQEKNEKNESKKLIILKLPGHTNRSSCFARPRNPAFRGTRRAGRNLSRSPLFASAKRRRAETAEARIGTRGTNAFLGEANAFLRGPGPIGRRERSPLAEVNESNNLSEIIPLSFQQNQG